MTGINELLIFLFGFGFITLLPVALYLLFDKPVKITMYDEEEYLRKYRNEEVKPRVKVAFIKDAASKFTIRQRPSNGKWSVCDVLEVEWEQTFLTFEEAESAVNAKATSLVDAYIEKHGEKRLIPQFNLPPQLSYLQNTDDYY